MGKIVMLTNVRCSFLELGDPKDYQGNKQFRWSATALFPLDSPLKKVIDGAFLEEAKAKAGWERKYKDIVENCMADPKGTCIIDGKRKDYDGYQGMWALTAHRYAEKGRPLAMDRDKSPIYKPNNEVYEGKAGVLYSGAIVNMQVELWCQDNKNGKGLRATLLGIQKAADADAFGGGTAPNPDAFGELATPAGDLDDLS
jgi:hypothetical protein